MSYVWLKKFDVDVGDSYPYFKIFLDILPPGSWNYAAPFYTFAIKLQVDSYGFGWYLYVGDLVDSVVDPGKEFVVEANLRLLDIHALSYRNTWKEKALRGEDLKINAEALVYLLNYQAKISTSKRVPASRVLEWVNKEGILRNDFIPLPSPSATQEAVNVVAVANVALLYRSFSKLREEVTNLINEKLRKLEPLIAIFEQGFESYRKMLEEDVKRRYAAVEPIMELVDILKKVTNGRLDENWALSTLVLAALENIVNLKLRELGESTSGDFRTRVSRLKEALVKKSGWNEREASDLARRLQGKYGERNIIIHGGYENPTTREAALEDFKFLKDILGKLFDFNLKDG